MIRVYKLYELVEISNEKSLVFINPYKLAKIDVSMKVRNHGGTAEIPIGEILFHVYHKQKTYGLQDMFTENGFSAYTPVSRLEIVNQIDFNDSAVQTTITKWGWGYYNKYLAGAGLHVFNFDYNSGSSWDLQFDIKILLTISAILS